MSPNKSVLQKAMTALTGKRYQKRLFYQTANPESGNSSESGHPHIFKDSDEKTYLFFQGNNDNGKTWYISKVEIGWTEQGPYIIR